MNVEVFVYPFHDTPNTACFVCRHILDGERPILFVSHDLDDGMWEFMCGDKHSEEDLRIIGMGEAFELDESIGLLAELPYGWCAERETKDSEWKTYQG